MLNRPPSMVTRRTWSQPCQFGNSETFDVMGDGPVAGIGAERPGVGDEAPGHLFVVVVGAALRVTGRDRWPC